jgi:hypothetical protein
MFKRSAEAISGIVVVKIEIEAKEAIPITDVPRFRGANVAV